MKISTLPCSSVQGVFLISAVNIIHLRVSEPEEPDHDDQPVGGAVLARLQAQVGPAGVRRRQAAPRAQRPHLAARHRALQQVNIFP